MSTTVLENLAAWLDDEGVPTSDSSKLVGGIRQYLEEIVTPATDCSARVGVTSGRSRTGILAIWLHISWTSLDFDSRSDSRRMKQISGHLWDYVTSDVPKGISVHVEFVASPGRRAPALKSVLHGLPRKENALYHGIYESERFLVRSAQTG